MLKIVFSIGFVFNLIFLVMYWYKIFRYEKVLVLLEKVKVKLICFYILYCLNVDNWWYLYVFSDQILFLKMREVVIWNIKFYNFIFYIQELRSEQVVSKEENLVIFNILFVVMVLFFQYFCSRYVDIEKIFYILREFQVLLKSDYFIYVFLELKDIFWELLGICY